MLLLRGYQRLLTFGAVESPQHRARFCFEVPTTLQQDALASRRVSGETTIPNDCGSSIPKHQPSADERLVVLIPDGEAKEALLVARCLAASARVTLHALSAQRWPELRFSTHCARFHHFEDTQDEPQRLRMIQDIVQRYRIQVILPVSDRGIRWWAARQDAVRRTVPLAPVPPPDAFDTATDKSRLASFLARHELPHPETRICVTGQDPFESVGSMSFPVLAKPPMGRGGFGIQCFDTSEQLRVFMEQLPNGAAYVVQSYLPGIDMGCSVLCQDGKVLAGTVQQVIVPGAPRFSAPVGIELRDDPTTMAIIGRLMAALNWSGVANVDLRRDARTGQVNILEVNGRFWATLGGSLNAGVNFPYLACQAALGRSFPFPPIQAARYFRTKRFALRALAGGGQLQVRRTETDLPHLLADPVIVGHKLTRQCWFRLRRAR